MIPVPKQQTLVCRLFKHLHTCMSSVETFATGIKIFDWQKVCLIAWSSLQKLLIASFFYRSKVELELCILDPLIFVVWRWPWSLDWLSKWALITWFNFDPSRKRFYMGYISDYPLKQPPLQYKNVSYSIEEESGNKASWEMILPLSVIGVVWVLVDKLLHPQWGVQPEALGSLPTLQTGYPCSTGKERNTNSKSTQADISEWREARWGFNRWWNVTQLDKI